jgi:hypothetical protein
MLTVIAKALLVGLQSVNLPKLALNKKCMADADSLPTLATFLKLKARAADPRPMTGPIAPRIM